MSDSDLDLLRRFARDHAQDAFTEIVRRHVNLVYSAALRQVRSPQLAEEISQSVFCDLAGNARKLCARDRPFVLTAWLYQVTRFTTVDVIRKESRRRLREQVAMEMNAVNAAETAWPDIEPLLDDAMAALHEADQRAVLLRYFENKSLREVGEALDVSEDAAQKRVNRAVERLRGFFSQRKITIGAGGLVVLVSANAVQSAPAGLAAAVSSAALAGAVASTSTTIAAGKFIAMTAMQKTVIGMALAAAIGAAIFEAHQASQLHHQVRTLRQQQAPLAGQIQELQSERDNATNQVAGLLAENAQLNSHSNEDELLKLRGEVGVLKEQAEQADQKAQNAEHRLAGFLSVKKQFKTHEINMVNDAKQIGLGMLIYADNNHGHFPTNLEQATNELGGYKALSRLNACDFDLINIATNGYVAGTNVTDATRFEHPNLVVLRERLAQQAPDGSWKRIYGFLDGSVVTATTYDGNFAAWEKVNTYSPPPNTNR